MAHLMLAVFVVFLQILGVGGDSEICYETPFLGHRRYFAYCDYGCCGNEYNRECCPNEDDGLVGIIIGCIIGGLIFLGLTVSCIVCLVCMSIKSQGNRGRVIAPLPQQQGNSNVAFVSTHMNWTNSSYPTQQQTAGYPMGYTQYTRPTGNFPQPPAYEERATPGTAPPEYPEPSELYRSHNHLQPLEGASTSAEQIPAALPPIAHTGMDTSKV